MLQEKLKEATRENHDQLEQLMFVNDIMSGTLSLAQYKQILTTNYLVHKAVEEYIFNSLSLKVAQELDVMHRQKLAALVKDLEELQMPVPDDEINNELYFSKNDAELLGAMYVLEGATLGGNVIVKRLKTNPDLNDHCLNFHYYQVYGDKLIPQWKKFCEVLNQLPEEVYDEAVTGAKKMFEYIAAVQQQSKVVQ